jgi:hypothetical protein
MYDAAMGREADLKKAAEWYRKAVEQGHAPAQNNLALMYLVGRGVPQDYAEALRLYRLAAESGDPYAYAGLGYMYLKGVGVERDLVQGGIFLMLAQDEVPGIAGILNDVLLALTDEQTAELYNRVTQWRARLQMAQAR